MSFVYQTSHDHYYFRTPSVVNKVHPKVKQYLRLGTKTKLFTHVVADEPTGFTLKIWSGDKTTNKSESYIEAQVLHLPLPLNGSYNSVNGRCIFCWETLASQRDHHLKLISVIGISAYLSWKRCVWHMNQWQLWDWPSTNVIITTGMLFYRWF